MTDRALSTSNRLENRASQIRSEGARIRNSSGGSSRWNSESFSSGGTTTGYKSMVSDPKSARADVGRLTMGGFAPSSSSSQRTGSSIMSIHRRQIENNNNNGGGGDERRPSHRPFVKQSYSSSSSAYGGSRQQYGGGGSRNYVGEDLESSGDEGMEDSYSTLGGELDDYDGDDADADYEISTREDKTMKKIREQIYNSARKAAQVKEVEDSKKKIGSGGRIEKPEALLSRLSAPFKKIVPRNAPAPPKDPSPEPVPLERSKRQANPPKRLIQEYEDEEDEEEGDDGSGDMTQEEESEEGSNHGDDRPPTEQELHAQQYSQLPPNIYQGFANNGPVANAPVPQTFGTITLAKNINPFHDEAREYFKCGASDRRECMGCISRISDPTTTELQPEMAAAVERFFRGFGNVDFFVLCDELSDHFNEVVIPIYNQRIRELEERQKMVKEGLTTKDRFVTTALKMILSSSSASSSLSSTLSTEFSSSSSSSSSSSPTIRSSSSSSSSTTLYVSSTAPTTAQANIPRQPEDEEISFTPKLKPLTKWSRRSVFDHWVFHVINPLVQELVQRLILIKNIQVTEGLLITELPGPGTTKIRELDPKNVLCWEKLNKALVISNTRLNNSLPTSRTVTESASHAWSTKGTISQAWQTSYSSVATIDDLYR